MLVIDDLITKMENKGVTFNRTTREEAIHFLTEHNYYVKLTAYKTNFIKHNDKYVGLDFSALQDLSTIDMHLRFLIIKACLNVEHSLKILLLNDIERKGLDDFIVTSTYTTAYSNCLKEIKKFRNTSYTKGLLNKYTHPKYPIWVFLEVISFGELVKFYDFYSKSHSFCPVDKQLLYLVRDLRNAAAHNNCLIHNLSDRNGYYNARLVNEVKSLVPTLKEKTIKIMLKNKSIQDFVAMLIILNKISMSDEIKKHRFNEFSDLYNGRALRGKNLYKSSQAIIQAYDFTKIILDVLKSHNV